MRNIIQLKIIVLTLISFHSFGQVIGSDQIDDDSKVKPWIAKVPNDYQGVYHFGESEGESNLILIFTQDKIYAQIRSGYWSADGKSWMGSYENIDDVKIEGNKFLSTKSSGQFVIYDNGTEKIEGLKITRPWSGVTSDGQYEVGIKNASVDKYFEGKFAFASTRYVDAKELRNMPKADLRIMRNEIFARYGFIFQPGGEMATYFKKQEWYQPQHKSIDNFLTGLEKKNIALIQKMESIEGIR